MTFDPALFGQSMGELIKAAVEPLKAEIQSLHQELGEAKSVNADLRQMIESMPKPENGKDADEAAIEARVKAGLVGWQAEVLAGIEVPELPDIKGMVDSAVAEAVKSIPAPQDGKSITLDDIAPLISSAIDDLRDQAEEVMKEMEGATDSARRAIQAAEQKAESLRQPEDGKSVTMEDVRPMIEDQIKQAVAAIPTPKDGVGLAGMLIDRDGNLLATMTNGEVKNLGPVEGKDGASLESLDIEYDAQEHEIILRASAAGKTKELRYPAGGIRHKGYWRDGFRAKAGESWTHDGSSWVAMKDTEDKPSTHSPDWVMSARKGRDGEDGKRVVVQADPGPIKVGGDDTD
ncbi:hypothetical protein ABRY94_11750 [Castellaniella ginsengisoli]|uniref:Phage portal protein n=1 Tax=Castellaniella ginsengisoli TaxID=546114 RepID=A0AB39ESH3_9BURK